MAEQVAESAHSDPAGPQVLMAIEMRAALALRVVEVDHGQPVEPDPGVEVGEECVDRVRLAQVDPGGPRVCRVETEPQSLAGDAAGGGGIGDGGQAGDIHAESEPAAGRVLENDGRGIQPFIDFGQDKG